MATTARKRKTSRRKRQDPYRGMTADQKRAARKLNKAVRDLVDDKYGNREEVLAEIDNTVTGPAATGDLAQEVREAFGSDSERLRQFVDETIARGTNVLHTITQRIVTLMESGELPPWAKPWQHGKMMLPRNFDGRLYNGLNVFHLMVEASLQGYDDPRWITFSRALKEDGNVRKGSKGTRIISWRVYEYDKDTGKALRKGDIIPAEQVGTRVSLGYHTVFNVEQTEGLELPPLVTATSGPLADPNDDAQRLDAQRLIDAYLVGEGIDLRYSEVGNRAFYSPTDDRIVLPAPGRFDSTEEYYATAFHEMGHSTGHESRLAREKGTFFGSHQYGREELVAEMTAALLCAHLGLHPQRVVDNNTAYLASWVRTIREDPEILVEAAKQAHRASQFVLEYADVGAVESDGGEAITDLPAAA